MINTEYSIQLEQTRIKKTLEKIEWYEKLGYCPRFPQNIDPKIDTLKTIYKALANEYIDDDYIKVAKEIEQKFKKIEKDFFTKLQEVCGKNIKKRYTVVLTKYGVGGSYSMPNRIIYNFGTRSFDTILHEIIHLAIEPYIIKYSIQQNEKERIVDLILKSKPIALKNYKMQERGMEDAKIIDPIFKKYFKPPIGNFFKELKKLRS